MGTTLAPPVEMAVENLGVFAATDGYFRCLQNNGIYPEDTMTAIELSDDEVELRLHKPFGGCRYVSREQFERWLEEGGLKEDG